MIVIFELPEAALGPPGELDGSILLKGFDEFDEIACARRAFRQHVHMVRHHAIRVKEKVAGGGVFLEA